MGVLTKTERENKGQIFTVHENGKIAIYIAGKQFKDGRKHIGYLNSLDSEKMFLTTVQNA